MAMSNRHSSPDIDKSKTKIYFFGCLLWTVAKHNYFKGWGRLDQFKQRLYFPRNFCCLDLGGKLHIPYSNLSDFHEISIGSRQRPSLHILTRNTQSAFFYDPGDSWWGPSDQVWCSMNPQAYVWETAPKKVAVCLPRCTLQGNPALTA